MNLPSRSLFLAAALAMPLVAQNQCITLQNGVDGYISVPYSPDLVPRTGLTVEAWLTYDETTLQSGWTFPTVARHDIRAQMESWFLRVEAGQNADRRLRFKVITTNGQYDASWNFNPGQMLTWTHVAGSYDGTTIRMIINGVQVASAPASGRLVDAQGDLRIGKGDDAILPAGETWNGSIDEFRLWPFGRTAAEVAASMDHELMNVPGLVSTWNFNGSYADTSNVHAGTATGSVSFMPGKPGLTMLPIPGAAPFGAAQQGCHGATRTTLGSLPLVGLQDFSIVGTGARPSGQGLIMVGFGSLPQPINVLGADVWVDLSQGFAVTLAAGPLGACRVPIPIPANPVVAGNSISFQFAWLDTNCVTPLWSSDGLVVVVLP